MNRRLEPSSTARSRPAGAQATDRLRSALNDRTARRTSTPSTAAPGAGPRLALLTLAFALTQAGCMTTHLARPVGANNTRVHASLGGPIVRLGSAPIPVPLSTLGVARGLGDDVDVHADLHPSALLFDPGPDSVPIFGADVGAAWHPIPRYRSALTIGGTLYGFGNKADAAVFADLWIAGGVRPLRWLFLSAGLHNLLRVGSSDREVDQRSAWAPTAFALFSFGPFGRTTLELEARWYSFTENGFRTAPNFVPIGQLGALGVLLGVSYQFPQGGGPR